MLVFMFFFEESSSEAPPGIPTGFPSKILSELPLKILAFFSRIFYFFQIIPVFLYIIILKSLEGFLNKFHREILFGISP